MSSLLSCKAKFKKSKDLTKLTFICYFATIILVLNASILLIYKILIIGFLAFLFLCIRKTKQSYCELIYEGKTWILIDKKNHTREFKQLKIIFSGGVFFLINLINDDNTKPLVIFFDEFDDASIRKIFIIDRLNN